MTLKDWLDRAPISCAAFADEIGVSRSSVFRWVSGKRVPHPRLALRIEHYTKGHVPVSVWVKTDHLPKGPAAILQWMLSSGLTATQAARLIGANHTSVYQWVHARVVPSPASLRALNEHSGLGLTLGDFR
jgi:DNA-binding transcriptional regulator YdaS (Cro superfamily)